MENQPEISLPLTDEQYNTVREVYENVGIKEYHARFKPTPQLKPKTYLLVHHPGGENDDRLFQSVKLHAEQNFMNAYETDEHRARSERVKLDMYITFAPCGVQGMDCATKLRAFAEDCNFKLNIKAAAPYYQNQKELCSLMTSEFCTVEAFTKEDYRHLSKYLGFPNNWEYKQNMIDRDRKTRKKLTIIRWYKSAWKVFTDTSIVTPETYLFVHQRGDKNEDELFTSDVESNAEQEFMEAFKNEAGEEQVQLDVYLTHGISCARDLRQFAEEYNFELKIKVTELAVGNDEDLQHLMTSRNCTVEAFKKQHYIDLANYLGHPLLEGWEPTRAMIERDQETQLKLRGAANNIDVNNAAEELRNLKI